MSKDKGERNLSNSHKIVTVLRRGGKKSTVKKQKEIKS